MNMKLSRNPRLGWMLSLGALAVAALVATTVGCGAGDEEDERPKVSAGQQAAPATGAAPSGPVAGATGTASVAGKITFDGVAPAREKYKMASDAFCAKQHPGEVEAEDLLVGADKGLANVFVYVKEGISGTYAVPSAPVVLDQKGCTYHPRVFGLVAGQSIDILNSDETLHNIHSFPEKNEAFNLGMPVKGMKFTKKFDKPEVMVRIKCDVHGWMHSYAGVLPHPFFSVSGADGSFKIENLPAGNYTIEAWHEVLGTQTQQVTVADKEAKAASFTFKKS